MDIGIRHSVSVKNIFKKKLIKKEALVWTFGIGSIAILGLCRGNRHKICTTSKQLVLKNTITWLLLNTSG